MSAIDRARGLAIAVENHLDGTRWRVSVYAADGSLVTREELGTKNAAIQYAETLHRARENLIRFADAPEPVAFSAFLDALFGRQGEA